MFGITCNSSSDRTQEFTIWEGDFMSSPVGSGTFRAGAKRTTVTLLDYRETKLRVSFPEGVTLPRTDRNYREIDDAISAALTAHFDAEGK